MKRILVLLLTLTILMTVVGCGKEPKEEVDMDEGKVANYEVVNKGDISIAAAKRYAWDVVVKEEMSVEDLEKLSKEIVEQAKKEKEFNALVIGFYDYEEYIGTGHALGKTEYAPEGDWSKADTVKTGDYKKMDYEYGLMEKDWDKQLSREEVDIYKAWKDLYKTKDEDPKDIDKYEDEISKDIAGEFNKTSEEVDGIIMKQVAWTFDNNK